MRNTYLILNGCGSWPGKVLVLLQVAHPYEYRSIFPLVRDLHPFFFHFIFLLHSDSGLFSYFLILWGNDDGVGLLKFNFLARNRCPVIWYKIYDTALDQYLNRTSHSSGLLYPFSLSVRNWKHDVAFDPIEILLSHDHEKLRINVTREYTHTHTPSSSSQQLYWFTVFEKLLTNTSSLTTQFLHKLFDDCNFR